MTDDETRRQFLEIGLLTASGLNACSGQGSLLMKMARKDFEPSYLQLERSGELAKRAQELYSIYRSCHLCPRRCGANRLVGEKGVCSSGARAKVYSAHPHFGEERPLVGRYGSGTIFFSHCNLLCVYCQNWQISFRGDGSIVSDDTLGRLMVDLQKAGCHNVNLVTPTHCLPNIIGGLRSAIARGLRIPLVYNCGGYEPVEILQMLDGIVDIYLPDFKYADGALAEKYSSGASDYPEVAAAAIQEMYRQVGDLVVDEQGIALRGLMVRHLVLPSNIAGTDKFVRFVAKKLSPMTYVNIMAQYRPEHMAHRYPELCRRITTKEYQQALQWAREAGLKCLDCG
jgi:putative pyruvate formate lyase activating enzyme